MPKRHSLAMRHTNCVGNSSSMSAQRSYRYFYPGTPLTLISGPLQDALSRIAEPQVKESLKVAVRNVARLSRLVDSLLDFSKIAANRLEGTVIPDCTLLRF